MTNVLTMRTVFALTLLALTACLSGGEDSGNRPINTDNCRAAEQRLRECNAITDGVFECGRNAIIACKEGCAAAASCNDLQLLVCDIEDTSRFSPTFFDCFFACDDITFTCASGAVIDGFDECNDFADCTDGSDETNCPPQPAKAPTAPKKPTKTARCNKSRGDSVTSSWSSSSSTYKTLPGREFRSLRSASSTPGAGATRRPALASAATAANTPAAL